MIWSQVTTRNCPWHLPPPLFAAIKRVAGRRERHRAEMRERILSRRPAPVRRARLSRDHRRRHHRSRRRRQGNVLQLLPDQGARPRDVRRRAHRRHRARPRRSQKGARDARAAAHGDGSSRPVGGKSRASSRDLCRPMPRARPCARNLHKRDRRPPLDCGNFYAGAGARRSSARSSAAELARLTQVVLFGVTLAWAMNPDCSLRATEGGVGPFRSDSPCR